MDATPLIESLKRGDVDAATRLLREQQDGAVTGCSILEDVFPIALTRLAEAYDQHGVTGHEAPYFELARELWRFMPEAEREIPDMLCTFLYAGCKFNQPDFVRWVLPVVAAHPAINIPSLVADRMFELNQLRHSALYYVAKNGSIELYDLLCGACGHGEGLLLHPLLMEVKVFERLISPAVATGQRPPQPTPVTIAMTSIPVSAETAAAGGTDAVMKRPNEPDPPALYMALLGGHTDFLKHVFRGLSSPAQQSRVIRTLAVHALIPLDDVRATRALHALAPLIDPEAMFWGLAMGSNALNPVAAAGGGIVGTATSTTLRAAPTAAVSATVSVSNVIAPVSNATVTASDPTASAASAASASNAISSIAISDIGAVSDAAASGLITMPQVSSPTVAVAVEPTSSLTVVDSIRISTISGSSSSASVSMVSDGTTQTTGDVPVPMLLRQPESLTHQLQPTSSVYPLLPTFSVYPPQSSSSAYPPQSSCSASESSYAPLSTFRSRYDSTSSVSSTVQSLQHQLPVGTHSQHLQLSAAAAAAMAQNQHQQAGQRRNISADAMPSSRSLDYAAAPTAVGAPFATSTSLGAAGSDASVTFHALHYCSFVHEHCADAHLVRWPPSSAYAQWLLEEFSSERVPHLIRPIGRMKWSGLLPLTSSVPATAAAAAGAAGSSSALALDGSSSGGSNIAAIAAIGASSSTSNINSSSSTVSGGIGMAWNGWTAFHSACAAGSVDIAALVYKQSRHLIFTPVWRTLQHSVSVAPASSSSAAAAAAAAYNGNSSLSGATASSALPANATFSASTTAAAVAHHSATVTSSTYAAASAAVSGAAHPVVQHSSASSTVPGAVCDVTAVVHPLRLAVESSIWTRRHDVTAWLVDQLLQQPPIESQQLQRQPIGQTGSDETADELSKLKLVETSGLAALDAQLYIPCGRALFAARPEFVKGLCKATPLSLRAMKFGTALNSWTVGPAASASASASAQPGSRRSSYGGDQGSSSSGSGVGVGSITYNSNSNSNTGLLSSSGATAYTAGGAAAVILGEGPTSTLTTSVAPTSTSIVMHGRSGAMTTASSAPSTPSRIPLHPPQHAAALEHATSTPSSDAPTSTSRLANVASECGDATTHIRSAADSMNPADSAATARLLHTAAASSSSHGKAHGLPPASSTSSSSSLFAQRSISAEGVAFVSASSAYRGRAHSAEVTSSSLLKQSSSPLSSNFNLGRNSAESPSSMPPVYAASSAARRDVSHASGGGGLISSSGNHRITSSSSRGVSKLQLAADTASTATADENDDVDGGSSSSNSSSVDGGDDTLSHSVAGAHEEEGEEGDDDDDDLMVHFETAAGRQHQLQHHQRNDEEGAFSRVQHALPLHAAPNGDHDNSEEDGFHAVVHRSSRRHQLQLAQHRSSAEGPQLQLVQQTSSRGGHMAGAAPTSTSSRGGHMGAGATSTLTGSGGSRRGAATAARRRVGSSGSTGGTSSCLVFTSGVVGPQQSHVVHAGGHQQQQQQQQLARQYPKVVQQQPQQASLSTSAVPPAEGVARAHSTSAVPSAEGAAQVSAPAWQRHTPSRSLSSSDAATSTLSARLFSSSEAAILTSSDAAGRNLHAELSAAVASAPASPPASMKLLPPPMKASVALFPPAVAAPGPSNDSDFIQRQLQHHFEGSSLPPRSDFSAAAASMSERVSVTATARDFAATSPIKLQATHQTSLLSPAALLLQLELERQRVEEGAQRQPQAVVSGGVLPSQHQLQADGSGGLLSLLDSSSLFAGQNAQSHPPVSDVLPALADDGAIELPLQQRQQEQQLPLVDIMPSSLGFLPFQQRYQKQPPQLPQQLYANTQQHQLLLLQQHQQQLNARHDSSSQLQLRTSGSSGVITRPTRAAHVEGDGAHAHTGTAVSDYLNALRRRRDVAPTSAAASPPASSASSLVMMPTSTVTGGGGATTSTSLEPSVSSPEPIAAPASVSVEPFERLLFATWDALAAAGLSAVLVKDDAGESPRPHPHQVEVLGASPSCASEARPTVVEVAEEDRSNAVDRASLTSSTLRGDARLRFLPNAASATETVPSVDATATAGRVTRLLTMEQLRSAVRGAVMR